MTKLQNLNERIAQTITNDFIWDRDVSKVIALIEDLHFMAETYKDNFYLTMLITTFNERIGKTHWLLPEEQDEYYTTKTISELDGFVPKTWVNICFNLKNKFLKVYVGENCDVNRTPRENFAYCFTQNKDYLRKNMARMKPDNGDFATGKYEYRLDNVYEYYETYKNLGTLFDWAQTHYVDDSDFYKKVLIPKAAYFEDASKYVRDDRYAETDPKEYIDLPVQHRKVNIPRNIMNIINGMSYESVYFKDPVHFTDRYEIVNDENTLAYTAEFAGLDFLYTVLDYINAAEKYETIEQVEKLHLSNAWINGEPNSAEFRITKVNGLFVFELEVRENGIVYMIKRCENKDLMLRREGFDVQEN